jgi:flagellar hook-associated protein 1 FlgK
VDPGPPSVSNGIALRLAGLGDSTDPLDAIAGQSILGFYGATAAAVGQAASSASTNSDGAAQSLNQAKAFRNSASGVSLDEEAVRIIELQRGFQAASKLISTVDSLTDSLMNMIR